MHLYDLPAGVPWLSLIWLSLFLPALAMMAIKPEQKQLIRIIGASGAFVSLVLSLLVFFAYDYASPARLQFVEELNWLPQVGIKYILGVDGISLPMVVLATALTRSVCPCKVRRSWPVRVSHSRTAWSSSITLIRWRSCSSRIRGSTGYPSTG